MNDQKNKNTHGGARQGAGRKAMYAEMKAMKVPTQYIPVIKAFIEHLNETDMIDKNYKSYTSEPFYIRSRQDKSQNISFTTSPVKAKEEQLDLINHIESKK